MRMICLASSASQTCSMAHCSVQTTYCGFVMDALADLTHGEALLDMSNLNRRH